MGHVGLVCISVLRIVIQLQLKSDKLSEHHRWVPLRRFAFALICLIINMCRVVISYDFVIFELNCVPLNFWSFYWMQAPVRPVMREQFNASTCPASREITFFSISSFECKAFPASYMKLFHLSNVSIGNFQEKAFPVFRSQLLKLSWGSFLSFQGEARPASSGKLFQLPQRSLSSFQGKLIQLPALVTFWWPKGLGEVLTIVIKPYVFYFGFIMVLRTSFSLFD